MLINTNLDNDAILDVAALYELSFDSRNRHTVRLNVYLTLPPVNFDFDIHYWKIDREYVLEKPLEELNQVKKNSNT